MAWFISQKAKAQHEANPTAQICFGCGKPAEYPWTDACKKCAGCFTVVDLVEKPTATESKSNYCSECSGRCNGGH